MRGTIARSTDELGGNFGDASVGRFARFETRVVPSMMMASGGQMDSESTTRGRSKSNDAVRRRALERDRRLTPAERVLKALELGRKSRELRRKSH
jgi:hypothetical protein